VIDATVSGPSFPSVGAVRVVAVITTHERMILNITLERKLESKADGAIGQSHGGAAGRK